MFLRQIKNESITKGFGEAPLM